MKKRVFIIHGWGFTPEDNWYSWLKAKLEENGFEVDVPAMPNTDEPIIGAWVESLASTVGEIDAQTYLIGHSIGCQTILRYLETQADKHAGGCVFVARWFTLAGELEGEGEEVVQISKPWTETPINFEQILQVTQKFRVFISDNDPYNATEENTKIFKEKLGASVTILNKKGHFTEDNGVSELPEALRAIQELAIRSE